MKYFLNTKIIVNGIQTGVYVIDSNQPNDDGFYYAHLYTEHGKSMGHTTYSIAVDHLFVSMQTNDCPQVARHIGIALDEHLFQQSLRLGKGGKLNKLASYGSHYFHWLQGFRADKSQQLPQSLLAHNNNSQNPSDINYLLGIYFDTRIAQLKSGDRVLSHDLGSLHMYLPDEIITSWTVKYPMIEPDTSTNKDNDYGSSSSEPQSTPTPLMKPLSCPIIYDDESDASYEDNEPTDDSFQINFN